MASERDLVVRFLGDIKDLLSKSDEASKGMDKWKKAAVTAGAAIAGAFAASKVIDFAGESIKAAEEDKKSQALLATQIRDTIGATDDQIASVEKFINKTERATGVLDDNLRPAFASLVRATKDTGEAQKEMAIAMDIAAARGVSLETVTTALEKAHNGSTGALGRLGLATKDASGNALELQQILQNATTTYAGAAEAAVTPSQRMSVAMQELKEQVGTALLPVMEKLATFLADTVLPAIQNMVAWVEAHWPQISAVIKADFEKVKGYVVPVIEELQSLWERFGTHILTVAKGTWDAVAGTIKVAIASIQAIVQPIVDILHGDWGKAWDDFSRRVKEAWEGIKQQVSGVVGAITGLIGGLVETVRGVPGQIASAAAGMWDGILGAFKSVVNKVIDLFNRLIEHIGIHVHINPPGPGEINFDWQLSEIPRLAKGGVVNSPTLALLGESGPEMVTPLGRGGGATFGGPVTIVLNGVTNPQQLAEGIAEWVRRNGPLPRGTVAA